MVSPDHIPEQSASSAAHGTRVPANILAGHRMSPVGGLKGQPLDPGEAQELQDLAQEGRRILGLMTPLNSTRSAGIEMELTIADREGRPLPLAPRVLSEMDRLKAENPSATTGVVTGEYARFNVELNSDPIIRLGPDFLLKMEMQLAAQIAQVSVVANRLGGHLASVGILPSIRREHLNAEWITEKQRYFDLEAALAVEAQKYPPQMNFRYESLNRGTFTVQLDEQGLHIVGPQREPINQPIFLDTVTKQMVRYNALDTSVQFHWGVQDQGNYVRDHRIADLISPIMVGACANSPLVLGGPTGIKENRLFVYSAMLHTRRVFLSERWLANSLSQLDDALSCGVILGPRGSKVADRPLTPLIALQLLQGTTWPLNRTVVTAHESTNSRELRIEHRPIPSQPTPADTLGAAALFYGLMAGMPEYLEKKKIDLSEKISPDELEKRLSFGEVIRNVRCACVDGLQTSILWFDNQKIIIRELLIQELLPVAKDGLRSLGVSESDIGRYLGVVERRILGRIGSSDLGVTPADIIRERFFLAKQLGLADEDNCNRISHWLSEMFTYRLGLEPRGIWDRYLEERGKLI